MVKGSASQAQIRGILFNYKTIQSSISNSLTYFFEFQNTSFKTYDHATFILIFDLFLVNDPS
jgi:hypothetical protein